MKKIILTTIGLFALCNISAQNYCLSFGAGMIKEEYTVTGASRDVKVITDIIYPAGYLHFKTIFKNNIEVGTGLRFYNYGYKIGFRNLTFGRDNTFSYVTEAAYRAFSIPLLVGYNLFFIPNRLCMNFNGAINFDFYFDHLNFVTLGGGGVGTDSTYIRSKYENPDFTRQFNILLSYQIGLQYITKTNVSIGLFAAYHAGLRDVWHSTIHCTKTVNGNVVETFAPLFTSRGSYWHFGIEIGYKFRKKT